MGRGGPECYTVDTDVVIRKGSSTLALVWEDHLPTCTEYTQGPGIFPALMREVAAHEFGHVLGLTDWKSADLDAEMMFSRHPRYAGFEMVPGSVDVTIDPESVEMATLLYPDTVVDPPVDVFLSLWETDIAKFGKPSDTAVLRWTDKSANYPGIRDLNDPRNPEVWDGTETLPYETYCPGWHSYTYEPFGQRIPAGVFVGTNSPDDTDVTVQWRLVDAPGVACSSGFLIAEETETIPSGEWYELEPTSDDLYAPGEQAVCLSSGAGHDAYCTLCATVTAGDTSGRSDNDTVYSIKQLHTPPLSECCGPFETYVSECPWDGPSDYACLPAP